MGAPRGMGARDGPASVDERKIRKCLEATYFDEIGLRKQQLYYTLLYLFACSLSFLLHALHL